MPLALSAACTAEGGIRGPSTTEKAEAISSAVTTLTPAELALLINSGSVLLIDVRTAEEIAQGTIPGAINIPLDQFDPLAVPDAGDREVILYCQSDRRSGLAAEKWVEATGKPIRHLAGGILAWQAAGQTIEAVETVPPLSE